MANIFVLLFTLCNQCLILVIAGQGVGGQWVGKLTEVNVAMLPLVHSEFNSEYRRNYSSQPGGRVPEVSLREPRPDLYGRAGSVLAGYSSSESAPCDSLVEAFGVVAANYTHCMVEFARPVKVCQKCIDAYLDTLGVYDSLGRKDGCKYLLLDTTNRTQTIVDVYVNIQSTWQQYNCQNCYSFFQFSVLNETSTISNYSNQTVEFFRLTVEFEKCIFNMSELPIAPIFSKNMTSNSSVCVSCLDQYRELNHHYETMQKQFKRNLCIDITDSMNTTFGLWHSVFNCRHMYADTSLSVLISCLLLCIPVIFYVLSRLFGHTGGERTFLKQKRLMSTVQRRRTSLTAANLLSSVVLD